ncbi:MAG: PEP-CTERM sorting domain-containing protein, partial [Verrucomicrobiota bacterium]
QTIYSYWSFNDSNNDVTAVSTGSLWDTDNPTISFSATGFSYKNDANFRAFEAFDGNEYTSTNGGPAAQWQANSGDIVSSPELTLLMDMTELEDFTFAIDLRAAALPGGNPPSATTAIEYTTNGGSSWTSSGLSNLSGFSSTVTRYDLDFSSIAAIENIADAGIRLTFEDVDGTDGLANLRMDNVQISAAAIPEPSTFALLAGALGLGLVMLRRRRA